MTNLHDSSSKMMELLSRLWPLHRTLNSAGTEHALEICGEYLPADHYEIRRYPPGKEVFTWFIPERFKVNEAWLEIAGERVADFKENPLHLLSYSLPQKIDTTLGAIRNHLWTKPERPHAIPWEFKFYQRSWGFCLRHRDLIRFEDNAPVHGVIDTEFTDDDFSLGDYYLPGESDKDILFITNICHPAQVNDSLSGLVVGIEMARTLSKLKNRRHGFRLIIVPETIGSIVWFSQHPKETATIEAAWFCEMVGHDNSFILQHSFPKNTTVDKAFLLSLHQYRRHGQERTAEFRKAAPNDEIVSNGPGIWIPTPSLTRWPYPEYHTSDDSPDIVSPQNLAEALDVLLGVWDILENNYYPLRTFTGPVMLSRYNLWVDWREDLDLNLKTESIMLMLEGDKSIVDIAMEINLPIKTIQNYLDKFYTAGLIRKQFSPWDETAFTPVSLECKQLTDKSVMRFKENRLYLRSLTEDDATNTYLAWLNDRETTQFLEARWNSYTLDDIKKFIIQTNNSKNDFLFGIFLDKSNEHIGNIKITQIDHRHKLGYIGIMIGKQYWGKGFGAEALELVTRYGFEKLKLHKLIAGIYANNETSYKAFLRAGFDEVGRLKKNKFVDNQFVDEILVEKINSIF